MFESLIVIALIGLFLALIIALFLQARSYWLEVKTTSLHSALVQGITKTYAGTREYGTADLFTVLGQHGALPDGLITGEALQHPYGGPITVTGKSSRFEIVFAELDDDVCAALASKFIARRRGGTGLYSIAINGTALVLPVTPVDTGSKCNSGVAKNTITWTYF